MRIKQQIFWFYLDGNVVSGEANSEQNVDEESRPFSDVFDRIYEAESAESTSNDADVDEVTSDHCRECDNNQINQSSNIDTSNQTTTTVLATENTVDANELLTSPHLNSENSIRTRPQSAWRRVSFLSDNIESTLNNVIPGSEQIDNTNTLGVSSNSGSVIIGSTNQIRESSRRLVYLDQQYCASMPTILNPTEESQLDLFNQDGKFILIDFK